MALLNYFTATQAKNFFSTVFDRKSGVAQLASIKQLNTLVDKINLVNSNTGGEVRVPFKITTPLIEPARLSASNSAWEVCLGNGTNCGPALNRVYKCTSGCLDSFADIVNTGTHGVYTLTINYDPTSLFIIGTRILVGNVPSATPAIVAVDKVSERIYTISVIDLATRLPIPGVLNNTYLDIILEIDQSLVKW